MKYKVAVMDKKFSADSLDTLFDNKNLDVTFINIGGRAPLTHEEMKRVLGNADGILAGTEEYTEDALRGSKVRVISRVGVGIDNVPNVAGIQIKSVAREHIDGLTEHTIALLLAAAKNIPEYNEKAHRNKVINRVGKNIAESNVLVIGFGRVGRKICEMLCYMGAEVHFYDRLPDEELRIIPEVLNYHYTRVSNIADAIPNMDFIVLMASYERGDPPIMTKEMFDLCNGKQIFVNTSRGKLVDEKAMIAALESGKLCRAAVDVTWDEPDYTFLAQVRNLIITPHVATNTRQTRKAMEVAAINNLIEGLEEK